MELDWTGEVYEVTSVGDLDQGGGRQRGGGGPTGGVYGKLSGFVALAGQPNVQIRMFAPLVPFATERHLLSNAPNPSPTCAVPTPGSPSAIASCDASRWWAPQKETAQRDEGVFGAPS
jgi:hypothetical protein